MAWSIAAMIFGLTSTVLFMCVVPVLCHYCTSNNQSFKSAAKKTAHSH